MSTENIIRGAFQFEGEFCYSVSPLGKKAGIISALKIAYSPTAVRDI